jgi:hypothetical protein
MAVWHIASFRCDAKFGRCRGIADIGQARTKPPEVLTLQHAIESLEQANAWLKEQLARIVQDK